MQRFYVVTGVFLFAIQLVLVLLCVFADLNPAWLFLPASASCLAVLTGCGAQIYRQVAIETLLARQNQLLIAVLKESGIEVTTT